MTIAAGMRFGAYEITDAIGAGGMGEVYRATDTNLKRDVAVKVLPETFAGDADRLARFQREAEVLASLNHSNIAQIYGLEKADAQTVIVMELVEGPTLADRIAEGPIPADEALGIARQVADALEAAHGAQIVHRDLKPENIKLRPDGTIKVLDFGIAKALDAQAISGGRSPVMTTPAVTETGVILGTAAYMSPEQARGQPVDQRTDIWAFGCLLFEMLTGQPAFGGDDVMLTLARVLDRDTDLSSIPGTISRDVRHTIKLCLEKDPRKRIADIRDVRLALDGAFEAGPARGTQIEAPARPRLVPLAAAAIVGAVLTWLVTVGLDEAPPRELRRSIHMLPADQPLNNPGPPLLAISPDGSRIAYGANGALYLRRLSELEARQVPGTAGEEPITPVFSPDGEWLLYGAFGSGGLKRISTDGGTPITILPQWTQGGWRWDSDNMIRYGDAACQIRQLAPAGGTPELIVEEEGFTCYEPTLLPGGDKLLFERRPDSAPDRPEIAIRSLSEGETTVLFPGKQPQLIEPGYLIYFDSTLGLTARSFDPDTLEYGNPVALVDDIFSVGPVGGAHFRVSPTGTLAYIRGESGDSFGFVLAVGDEAGRIDPLPIPPRTFAAPSVSPAGDQVAVQVDTGDDAQIYVYDLSGDSEIRQLTFDGGNRHPTWTPDGQWITYSSNRDGRWRIYRQRADGRGLAEALTNPVEDKDHAWPAWTPDGEQLAFSEDSEGEASDIWIVSPPDGEPELLVGGSGGAQGALAFSPNGEAMSYHSFEAGTVEVFVEPFPRDGSRVRASEAGVVSGWPVWSRDGTRLSYQVVGGRFIAVDIDSQRFAIRNRRDLPFLADPNLRRLDSLPDGDRMIVATPTTGSAGGNRGGTEVVIVENWIEELKQRVPLD